MRIRGCRCLVSAVFLVGLQLGLPQTGSAADPPSVSRAMAFKPRQADVEYETPAAAEYARCKVNVIRKGKVSGWVVLGANGATLRKFLDTNGDNVVDRWSYYRQGLEVYRDIDSDFNNKIDQCRWLNTGGSRWGIDRDADRTIDQWKRISAEEASREAIRALVTGKVEILKPLLLSASDAKSLGLPAEVAEKIATAVSDPQQKLKKAARSKLITSKTRWMQFIAPAPSIIPAEQIGSTNELFVYENAMATVEVGTQTGLVQIGELVRVGDVWKLTSIPQPMDGNAIQLTLGGFLMQPTVASGAATTPTVDPRVRKLVDELQELDKNGPSPTAGKTSLAAYHGKRADLLVKIRRASKEGEERGQWTRQLADGLATGAQTGAYVTGLSRLKKLESEVRSDEKALLPYVAYRRLVAEYSVAMRETTTEKRGEVQSKWLKDLENFIGEYPKAQESAEVALQLAMTNEFQGDVTDARRWYQKLVDDFADALAAGRATGALRRMDLKGQLVGLKGVSLSGDVIDTEQYRGKVILVLFWSTWCKPCTEDLPQIRALYEQYADRGFEILGVNLDIEKELVQPYLTQHRVRWPQLYEPGGLDSPLARQYGIITLPTMFLVDTQGKVVNKSASVADLKTSVPKLIKKK